MTVKEINGITKYYEDNYVNVNRYWRMKEYCQKRFDELNPTIIILLTAQRQLTDTEKKMAEEHTELRKILKGL